MFATEYRLSDGDEDAIASAVDDYRSAVGHEELTASEGDFATRLACSAIGVGVAELRDSELQWICDYITFPVRSLVWHERPHGRTTCGTCGRAWDDDKVTSMTPAPAARCPFEAFHHAS